MSNQIADITMHIDENTTHENREKLRDELLGLDGVMAASYHDEKPHLMVLAYDPDVVNSSAFIKTAQAQGLHAELIGL
ncbi:MAG: ATP-binding protein [Gammaproteobacteria bacterium]|nr:ATP-binding protein [Gammaproteobacteria bacterium]MDH3449322.1 ATP-binding protein [Gammaproteobacteria bacterium]